MLLASLVVVGAGLVLLPSLRVGTRQWAAAPMFFVSVRAEMDEPVVLREVRRVTDELRDQPGVANAWSVADLFAGVTLEETRPAASRTIPSRSAGSSCRRGPIRRFAWSWRAIIARL